MRSKSLPLVLKVPVLVGLTSLALVIILCFIGRAVTGYSFQGMERWTVLVYLALSLASVAAVQVVFVFLLRKKTEIEAQLANCDTGEQKKSRVVLPEAGIGTHRMETTDSEMEPEAPDPALTPRDSQSGRRSSPGDLRVVLLESNAVSRGIAVGLLKKMGISVDLADSLDDVAAMVHAEPYDAVLMDTAVMEPGPGVVEDGEVCHGVRLARVPVIAMTSADMETVRDQVDPKAVSDWAAKPLEPLELFQAFKRLMATQKSPRPDAAHREALFCQDDAWLDGGELSKALMSLAEAVSEHDPVAAPERMEIVNQCFESRLLQTDMSLIQEMLTEYDFERALDQITETMKKIRIIPQ